MGSRVIVVVLIASLTNIITPTEIVHLSVPELVESSQNDVILDCTYMVEAQFVLQWLLNGSVVYEWSPGAPARVGELLDGRIDLSYRPSVHLNQELRAIRITNLDPELSGDYTCQVVAIDRTVSQSKNMLIYSTEEDFFLEITPVSNDIIVAKCMATRLYPQPELILQLNNEPIRLQWQRVWRKYEPYYEANCEATLTKMDLTKNGGKQDRISCILHLPLAGYTAIRDQHGYFLNGGSCSTYNFVLLSLVTNINSIL